ncbi:hypothetical protein B0H12DRAFT_1072718 [Mycena haematopus]|nr:hypothetical protein B0H12DRAFT_1072718 [Mycena haematopus]
MGLSPHFPCSKLSNFLFDVNIISVGSLPVVMLQSIASDLPFAEERVIQWGPGFVVAELLLCAPTVRPSERLRESVIHLIGFTVAASIIGMATLAAWNVIMVAVSLESRVCVVGGLEDVWAAIKHLTHMRLRLPGTARTRSSRTRSSRTQSSRMIQPRRQRYPTLWSSLNRRVDGPHVNEHHPGWWSASTAETSLLPVRFPRP